MPMNTTEGRSKAIFGAIALVVGVVILIAIAALIVGSILDSDVFSVTEGTNTNETLSDVSNITTLNFAILSTNPNSGCTLLFVTNSTDGVSIGSGNYTQPTSCQLLASAGGAIGTFNGTDWNVTYNFLDDSKLIINASELTDGFSAFVLGIVTFLGIIGIIIGIVWLISYLKPLFSKDEGIQSFAGS